MKQRLQSTSEHHRNKSLETGADHDAVTDTDIEISKQFEQTRALHEKMAGYVRKGIEHYNNNNTLLYPPYKCTFGKWFVSRLR